MTIPDHDQLRAQVSAYFDGELPPADEPAVVEHLATCEECQELIGDVAGLHAAVARGPKEAEVAAPAPAPTATPRRRGWMIGGAVLAAAAAVAIVWKLQPAKPGAREVAIALADHRAVEVRFGAGPFAQHRPYEVVRGGAAGEGIPLAMLAELEKRGQTQLLAAALASNGEAARAAALLATLPDSPDVLSDRAAVAVLVGDHAQALALADRARAAGASTAGWNRALALRELGYPLAAAAAFDAVAQAGDGWSAEARERARALRDDFQRRRAATDDVVARGAAMVAGTGPLLTAADVATAPAPSRVAFFDAVRVAPDASALAALRPLAEALDAEAGPGASAVATLARVATSDFAVRARFTARYRGLVAGKEDGVALVRDLTRAGAAVADLRIGALVLTVGSHAELVPELEAALAGVTDPWFVRALAHARIAAARASNRDLAEQLARAAVAGCDPGRFDFRCARLARDLAEVLAERGAVEEAALWLDRAVDGFGRAGYASWDDNTRLVAADLQRVRGEWSRARAGYDEAQPRMTDATPCAHRRLIGLGLAEVARYQNDLALARASFPAPTSCDSVPDDQSLVTVVDLALQTNADEDHARARQWLEAARTSTDPVVPIVAARLDVDRDPERARWALLDAIPQIPADARPGVRVLAYRSLARAASADQDWAAVIVDADAELGRIATGARCELVINPDERVMIIAASGPGGSAVGARFTIDDPDAHDLVVPATILDAVKGCPQVAVIARPPLHGRAGLLPPPLPWAFVGGTQPEASVGAPRSIIVADTEPPADDVRLPRLAATDFPADATAITGAAATPSRVLAELATATYAELHAHGIANLAEPGTSFLALSPDRDGAWQLTAAAVAQVRLGSHPVIVLGACKAAATTPRWDARWSLPDAFLTAGARAVIAADVDLPDREAAALFAKLRARIAAGEAPAVALAAERAAAVAAGQAWAAHLMVFE